MDSKSITPLTTEILIDFIENAEINNHDYVVKTLIEPALQVIVDKYKTCESFDEAIVDELEKENKATLSGILTYHVVSGKLGASDVVAALKKGMGKVTLPTLNGQNITVMQKDGKIWIQDAKGNYSEIIATDVMGSNGVIHVINTVVMPE